MAIYTQASDVVRGIGFLTTFWKRLEKAVSEVGGNEGHLARLAKDDASSAITKFAEILVHGMPYLVCGVYASYFEAIQAGQYHELADFAMHSSILQKSWPIHPVCGEFGFKTQTETARCERGASEVYDWLGENRADLSDLLAFGAKYTDLQLKAPVVVLWKDEQNRFWRGILRADDHWARAEGPLRRVLIIGIVNDPNLTWPSNTQFLAHR